MKKRPLYYQYITEKEDREITQMLHSMLGPNSKSLANKIGCDYQDMLNRITNQPRSPRKLELVLRVLDFVENPEPFIRWFNLRYGFLPPVKRRRTKPTAKTAQQQLIRTVKEIGDISNEFLKAYEDLKLDPDETGPIIKEVDDLIQAALEMNDILFLIQKQPTNGACHGRT